MKIKELRLSRGMTQETLIVPMQEIDGRIRTPDLSKMEGGIVNPTPEMFRVICQVLEATPDEVCDPVDVDYGLQSPAKAAARRTRKECYHLSVRLPKELASALPEMWEAAGYDGPTDWINHCIRNLRRQYKRKMHDASI